MFQLGLKKPVEVTMWRENDIIAGLTRVERHNLIVWFLLEDISLDDTEYQVK